MSKTIRVLIGKPGLDGHDVGAKVICRALMDAGMDVIYTGLRQSPQEIAQVASKEKVDVIGLSILSGAHLTLCRKFADEMRQHNLTRCLWVVGGNIPKKDHEALREIGVHGVFQTGTPFELLIDFIRERVQK